MQTFEENVLGRKALKWAKGTFQEKCTSARGEKFFTFPDGTNAVVGSFDYGSLKSKFKVLSAGHPFQDEIRQLFDDWLKAQTDGGHE